MDSCECVDRNRVPRVLNGRIQDDAPDFHVASQYRLERIGNIVLMQFTRAPAGNVLKPIAQREVDIGDHGRYGFERLQHRRQSLW